MVTSSPLVLIQRQRAGITRNNSNDSANNSDSSEDSSRLIMKRRPEPPLLLRWSGPTGFSSSSSNSKLHCRQRCAKRGLWLAVAVLIALQTLSFLQSQQQQQQQQQQEQWMVIEPPSAILPPRQKERTFPRTVSLGESISASYFVQRRSNNNNNLPPLKRMLGKPDYGELEFYSLLLMPPDAFQRTVRDDDWYEYHYEQKARLKAMDKIARKDDKVDGYDEIIVDGSHSRKNTCTPQKWAYEITQNCNSIHEDIVFDTRSGRTASASDQFYDFRYLSNGHYRDTYLFTPVSPTAGDTDIVVKEFRYPRDFSRYNMQNINREALILEKLSGSDRITKIYGHCGTTVLIERGWELSYQMVPRLPDSKLSRGRIPQDKLDLLEKDGNVHPMNNFTAEEKLDIAIALTEGVAELHGYKEGVIAHDDISIDQWMLSAEGKVIFTDFNNCVPMEWDLSKNRYCKFWASYPGTFKAPEVYGGDHMVTEQVDIWPVGNLIFALLTGLKPYYDETEEEVIQDLALDGVTPYLNPGYRTRSYIEGRMVEIMERCHKRDPEERVDIFEVVQHLRTTKERHEKMKREADQKAK